MFALLRRVGAIELGRGLALAGPIPAHVRLSAPTRAKVLVFSLQSSYIPFAFSYVPEATALPYGGILSVEQYKSGKRLPVIFPLLKFHYGV